MKTGGKREAVKCSNEETASLVTDGGSSSDIKLLWSSLCSSLTVKSTDSGGSTSGCTSINGSSFDTGGKGRGSCGGADRAALRDDEENWKGATCGESETISGEGIRKEWEGLREEPGIG